MFVYIFFRVGVEYKKKFLNKKLSDYSFVLFHTLNGQILMSRFLYRKGKQLIIITENRINLKIILGRQKRFSSIMIFYIYVQI